MHFKASSRWFYDLIVEPVLWRLEDLSERLGLSFLVKDQVHHLYMKFTNPLKAQISFLEDFDEWLSDGANMVDAMDKIALAARAKGVKNSFHERAAVAIGKKLRSGGRVSEGMKGLFHQEIIDLFHVGKRNNTISLLMGEYLKNHQESKDIRKSFWSGLRYPLGLTALMLVLMVVIAKVAVPYLNEMGISTSKLPGDTETLVAMSAHFGDYLSWYLNGAYVFYLIVQVMKKRYVGKYRNFLDKYVFMFSVHKSLVADTAIKKIALLQKSDISLSETVRILLRYSTPYERVYFTQINKKLSASTGTVAEYLDVGLLDPAVYAKLASLASLEGEEAKLNAIYVAGQRSGEAAKKSIQNASKAIIWITWITTIVLAFHFVMGALDFTLNMDQIIRFK